MSGSQNLGMALFIIFMLVAIASYIVGIVKSNELIKDKRKTIDYKAKFKVIFGAGVIFSVLFDAALFMIYLWNSYTPTVANIFQVLFGGLIFALSISIGLYAFMIHYYKKETPKDIDKKLFITLMVSVAVCFISFLAATDGFADMKGPRFLLPNGISFTTGWAYPNSGSANIAFYAICILTGAVFVYFYCDHKLYMMYGKHGTLELTFITAFPAGIIGARIAYVIGNWHEFANRDFWHVFAIWEGGLTILGGAIVGIAVGVLVYMKTNKGRSIWRAVDLIVPTILIAQAVGRWGNFFNCEVHGGMVNEEYWWWLPRIVFNNAHYSSTQSWSKDGFIYAPLFLIEAMVNMLGFFTLAHVFDKRFKNITQPGDVCFGYLIWYGFTRVFMEPLRDSSFNMGADGYWSWFWSLIFVAAGILLIIINHLVRLQKDTKKGNVVSEQSKKHSLIGLPIVAVISVIFITVGAILMANNVGGLQIALNGFNVGVIFLVVGISLLLTTFIPGQYIYLAHKQTPVTNE